MRRRNGEFISIAPQAQAVNAGGHTAAILNIAFPIYSFPYTSIRDDFMLSTLNVAVDNLNSSSWHD